MTTISIPDEYAHQLSKFWLVVYQDGDSFNYLGGSGDFDAPWQMVGEDMILATRFYSPQEAKRAAFRVSAIEPVILEIVLTDGRAEAIATV